MIINISLEFSESHFVLGDYVKQCFLEYLDESINKLEKRVDMTHTTFFDVGYWEAQSNLEILRQLKNQLREDSETL
jgi:hypothetical protein